jgi:hypothetical protein
MIVLVVHALTVNIQMKEMLNALTAQLDVLAALEPIQQQILHL